MADIQVTIDSAEVEKWLGDMPDNINKVMQNVIYKGAFMIEREAKINAPVDTGRLRASISSDIRPLQATIQPHVNYAIYVHEGTRHISPNPFMQRAADVVQGKIDEIVQAELRALE